MAAAGGDGGSDGVAAGASHFSPISLIKREAVLGEWDTFSYLISGQRVVSHQLPPARTTSAGEVRPRHCLLSQYDPHLLMMLAVDNLSTGPTLFDVMAPSAAVIARSVLFLGILSRLPKAGTPARDTALEYLWVLWYDAGLTNAEHAWLMTELDATLADVDGGAVQFGRPSDKQEVRAALAAWRALPGGTEGLRRALRDRRVTDESFLSTRGQLDELEETLNVLLGGVLPSDDPLYSDARDGLEFELTDAIEQGASGSFSWRSARDGGEGQGSAGPRPPFAPARSCTCPNPTFLQPATGRWTAHLRSLFFHAWAPHSGRETKQGFKAMIQAYEGRPGALTAFCAQRLLSLACEWADGCSDPAVCSQRWWVGEACEIVSAVVPLEPTYDFVDVGGTMDRAGLANLLAVFAPRLWRSDGSGDGCSDGGLGSGPHSSASHVPATLRTQTLNLHSEAPYNRSVEQWVKLSTGVPLPLVSTLFGAQLTVASPLAVADGTAVIKAAHLLAAPDSVREARSYDIVRQHYDQLPDANPAFQLWTPPPVPPAPMTLLELLLEDEDERARLKKKGQWPKQLTAAEATAAMSSRGPPSALLASGEDRSGGVLAALEGLADSCAAADVTFYDAFKGLAANTPLTLYLTCAQLARRCTEPAATMAALLRRMSRRFACLASALEAAHATFGARLGLSEPGSAGGAASGGPGGPAAPDAVVLTPAPGALKRSEVYCSLPSNARAPLDQPPLLRVLLLEPHTEQDDGRFDMKQFLQAVDTTMAAMALARLARHRKEGLVRDCATSDGGPLLAGVTGGNYTFKAGRPEALVENSVSETQSLTLDSMQGVLHRQPLERSGGASLTLRWHMTVADVVLSPARGVLGARPPGSGEVMMEWEDGTFLAGAQVSIAFPGNSHPSAAALLRRCAMVVVDAMNFSPLSAAMPLSSMTSTATAVGAAHVGPEAVQLPPPLAVPRPSAALTPPGGGCTLRLELGLLTETARGAHALVNVHTAAPFSADAQVVDGGYSLLVSVRSSSSSSSGSAAEEACSLRLGLHDRVDGSTVRAKVSSKRGLVWLHVRRFEGEMEARISGMLAQCASSRSHWTADALQPESLPPWPPVRWANGRPISPADDNGEGIPWSANLRRSPHMYDATTRELIHLAALGGQFGSVPKPRGVRKSLKDALTTFILLHLKQGRRVFAYHAARGAEPSLDLNSAKAALAGSLCIIVHSVRRDLGSAAGFEALLPPAGGPVAFVSYLDLSTLGKDERAEVVEAQAPRVRAALLAQSRAVRSALEAAGDGAKADMRMGEAANVPGAPEGELPLLQGLLQRNAALTVAPSHITDAWPLPWRTSFLRPDYVSVSEAVAYSGGGLLGAVRNDADDAGEDDEGSPGPGTEGALAALRSMVEASGPGLGGACGGLGSLMALLSGMAAGAAGAGAGGMAAGAGGMGGGGMGADSGGRSGAGAGSRSAAGASAASTSTARVDASASAASAVVAEVVANPDLPPDEGCRVCGAKDEEVEGGLLRCNGCAKVWYCGRDCQKKDWKGGHKAACVPSGS